MFFSTLHPRFVESEELQVSALGDFVGVDDVMDSAKIADSRAAAF
jgi:hypothetical protein